MPLELEDAWYAYLKAEAAVDRAVEILHDVNALWLPWRNRAGNLVYKIAACAAAAERTSKAGKDCSNHLAERERLMKQYHEYMAKASVYDRAQALASRLTWETRCVETAAGARLTQLHWHKYISSYDAKKALERANKRVKR